MPAPLAVAAFFTIWWISLFVVLPLAARSGREVEEAVAPPGVDRGAPIAPHLARVVVWTTALAAAIFVVVDAFAYWMG
jgi:predicted secreted protein